MSDTPDDIRRKAIDAALALAVEGSWRRASLRDIAARADLPLHALHAEMPCKTSILAAMMRDADAAVRSNLPAFEDEDTVRDRLFEVLMSRFDVLTPQRAGLLALSRDLPRDPLSGLLLAPTLLASMAAMLEAAGVSSKGPLGLVRAKGLAAVWLATMRVWLRDDTQDLARTMAALDRNLRRAEQLAMLLDRGPFPRPAPRLST